MRASQTTLLKPRCSNTLRLGMFCGRFGKRNERPQTRHKRLKRRHKPLKRRYERLKTRCQPLKTRDLPPNTKRLAQTTEPLGPPLNTANLKPQARRSTLPPLALTTFVLTCVCPFIHTSCVGTNTRFARLPARFGTAGRIQRKLAEWYEDDRNFDECVDQYRQASDYYLGENMVDQSDICLLKCAYYQGLLEEFDEAAEIYSAVGLRCLDNNLLKFNSRDYFLRVGLL